MKKIMIVDDDRNICELLRLYIEKEGFETAIANDGKAAVQMFDSVNPDLMLLDIMLPELDGWQVCREIRKKSQCPIIMLTAKGEVFDKVLGLELGADDYIAKPFGILELIARVKANLRKSRAHADTLRFGDIEVNDNLREISANGKILALTLKEYELLKLLVSYAPNVVKRDEILTAVWGEDYFGETRTLDIHTASLRKALAQAESGTKINTGRGVGYSLSFTREKA